MTHHNTRSNTKKANSTTTPLPPSPTQPLLKNKQQQHHPLKLSLQLLKSSLPALALPQREEELHPVSTRSPI
ncbi:unnamed protein product [Ambrosiozyma monospora]|uniref:Unnamed protein product n=1 Tax=Ambrosiozyma monospora TaxID=43982 RepID=A0A9W7DI33_AMBMO|nr:unnamed protein product [Ambrosiozyma monospora]